MAILGKALVELFLRHNGLHIPAQGGKNGVPEACTDGGVEQELPVAHACHSCRDGDEMADDGHETTCQRGCDAVLVEVALALLHLLLIEQAEMSPAAIGKAIDDGSAEIASGKVVDGGSAVGSDGGSQNDHPHVQVSASGEIGSRWHHKLRGHRYDCTLQQHEEPYPVVVEVFKNELVDFHDSMRYGLLSRSH